MSRKELLRLPNREEYSDRVEAAPFIVLISGVPSCGDCKDGLERLSGNRWFQHATRIALPASAFEDWRCLAAFAGVSGALLSYETGISELARILRLFRDDLNLTRGPHPCPMGFPGILREGGFSVAGEDGRFRSASDVEDDGSEFCGSCKALFSDLPIFKHRCIKMQSGYDGRLGRI